MKYATTHTCRGQKRSDTNHFKGTGNNYKCVTFYPEQINLSVASKDLGLDFHLFYVCLVGWLVFLFFLFSFGESIVLGEYNRYM